MERGFDSDEAFGCGLGLGTILTGSAVAAPANRHDGTWQLGMLGCSGRWTAQKHSGNV